MHLSSYQGGEELSRRTVIFFIALLAVLCLMSIACKRVTITEYTIDRDSCNGCGECVRACPADAVYLDVQGKARIDQSKCTQCGDCVVACPQNAIY